MWSRYWARGATHSCAGSYDDRYGGAFAAFWNEAHARTAPGARVLDIGTGNGAVPRLLCSLRPDLDMRIDAVDIASLPMSDWTKDYPRVDLRVHRDVRAEALPFEDSSFDLVVSQFGVEYAERGAFAELVRVLARNGAVALVMHHTRSRPVTLARIELAHIDWLLGADGFVAAARQLQPLLALAATPAGRLALSADPQAEAARVRFNAAQDALGARARREPDGADVLFETQDAAAYAIQAALQQRPDEAAAAIESCVRELDDSRFRLTELVRCALDEGSAREIADRLAADGLAVELDEIRERDLTMAWSLRATR